MVNSRDLPVLNPVARAFVLRKAYITEFDGNIKEDAITLAAAEAWAKDYPEVFQEYLGAAHIPYIGA